MVDSRSLTEASDVHMASRTKAVRTTQRLFELGNLGALFVDAADDQEDHQLSATKATNTRDEPIPAEAAGKPKIRTICATHPVFVSPVCRRA